MFLRNCWYVAAWSNEVGADEPLARTIVGKPIVLFRDADGGIVALADRCGHRLAPLSEGHVENGRIRCLYHGICFDSAGRCVEIPGQDRIPDHFAVPRFAVVERDGWIWVWPGDQAEADPSLVPASQLLQPGWDCRRGNMTYTAGYELLNDNLCDFSHLTHVHAKTFAMLGGDLWTRTRPTITRLERGLRFDRWVSCSPMPPFVHDLVDVWVTYDYLVPGVLLLQTNIHPAGTAESLGFGPPTTEPLQSTYNAQAVTPMTERTTRYFYALALPESAPEGQLDLVFQLNESAFHEDRAMVEAQQRGIDLNPGLKLEVTSHDQGPVQFRRVIEQMLNTKQSMPTA